MQFHHYCYYKYFLLCCYSTCFYACFFANILVNCVDSTAVHFYIAPSSYINCQYFSTPSQVPCFMSPKHALISLNFLYNSLSIMNIYLIFHKHSLCFVRLLLNSCLFYHTLFTIFTSIMYSFGLIQDSFFACSRCLLCFI